MVALNEVSDASKFTAKFDAGLAASRPSPASAGDAYYATNTQVLSVSANGSTWNEYDMTAIGGIPDVRCRLTNTTDQTIAESALVSLTWDTEAYDTDSMHSTGSNTERITCVTPGTYDVKACIVIGDTAIGMIELIIKKFAVSGSVTTIIAKQTVYSASDIDTALAASVDIPLAAGDYVYAQVQHANATAVDVTAATSFMSARLVAE